MGLAADVYKSDKSAAGSDLRQKGDEASAVLIECMDKHLSHNPDNPAEETIPNDPPQESAQQHQTHIRRPVHV